MPHMASAEPRSMPKALPMTSAPEARELVPESPITVLLVDDDHWVTAGLEAALNAAPDIMVRGVAHTGAEAVAAYRAQPVDIVLMDINMGAGMTGVDATAAIIREDPLARVLILTTTAPGPGLARALRVGATAALNKTTSRATLLRMIRAAARGDSPRLLQGLASDLIAGGELLFDSSKAVPDLTPAEIRTLLLICEGQSYAEIATQLYVTEATVLTHAKRLRQKLHARSLAQLVLRAIEYRFIDY